jgi:hypothetical protein
MRDTAIEVGKVICEGALRIGVSSLRCYDDAFVISLAWMVGAMVLAVALMATRGLRGGRA